MPSLRFRPRPLALWMIAILPLAAALSGCGKETNPAGGSTVTVPNVVGETQAAATASLAGAGLLLGTIAMANSATVASGSVVSESPAAGTSVASGSAVALTVSSGSSSEKVIYSFKGGTADGANPYGWIIQGSDGNFYGQTLNGGSGSDLGTLFYTFGGGTIFQLTPSGVETVLYSFPEFIDIQTGLLQASDGNLYGIDDGGTPNNPQGVVFKLTPAGVYTQLYLFNGGAADGAEPTRLIQGSDGNLYGVTRSGGAHDSGVVFKLTLAGVETVLYTFTGGNDGSQPVGILQASDGNFYGTTGSGGAGTAGTVFKLTPAGVLTVLHSFTGGADGGNLLPANALIQARDGNLYGTAPAGGTTGTGYPGGHGTVFKLTPAGVFTVLYSFTGGADGASPSGVIQGGDGNLYGTAAYGGSGMVSPGIAAQSGVGAGTLFQLTTAGAFTLLYSFTGGADGGNPAFGLIQATDSHLYATTVGGGTNNYGALFQY